MMTNGEFLNVIRESFKTYLLVGTSRSTAKLKSLHGHIARDLQEILGDEFEILSQGVGNDKEGVIDGRYYSKNVDITIRKNHTPIAGVGIKFVVRNYSQNSNNYFENMLGETANIRANNVPYFQIFIALDKMPYYEKAGKLKKYDIITEHNLSKYLNLSRDDSNVYYHTPNKTLIVLVSLKEKSPSPMFTTDKDYAKYYVNVIDDNDTLGFSDKIFDGFSNGVILNNYEDFVKRISYIILGSVKS